nr:uncharacterized protein LOC112005316 isoform X2 [Quercus suber]
MPTTPPRPTSTVARSEIERPTPLTHPFSSTHTGKSRETHLSLPMPVARSTQPSFIVLAFTVHKNYATEGFRKITFFGDAPVQSVAILSAGAFSLATDAPEEIVSRLIHMAKLQDPTIILVLT